MRPSRLRLATTFVTIAALGVVASACGSSSKAADKVTTTTVPAPVTITAGDYAFGGVPKTIPAGIVDVRFVNKGSVQHEMVWIKVAAGTAPKAAFAALGKVLQGEAFPSFFLGANGIGQTGPGKTLTTKFNLSAGDYIALCTDTGVAGSTKDGQPHFARGMYKQVTVTGTGGNIAPTASASITAHDYGFVLSGLKAGENTIAFKDNGPTQWHFADVNVFPKGTTVAQAETSIPKILASQGPPPAGVAAPTEVASSQIASPGHGNTFTATLEKGRTYVVFCFVSDLKGGPPHAIAHKMYKVFTIS